MNSYHNLTNFGFNGRSALEAIIKESSYKTINQAVASMTLFSNPLTVSSVNKQNVFRIIRASMSKREKRGDIVEKPGVGQLMIDDNKGPTDAFIWANNISRNQYNDVQFCHIWDEPYDVECYTNLANICMIPAFLAKLSDSDQNIKALLRYRALCLYNFKPARESNPSKPHTYDTLEWSAPLPPTNDLEKRFRSAMKTKPKDRTTCSARQIGWYFSKFEPDLSL